MSALDEVALGMLAGRHIATLATQRHDGLIHLTAMWYMYKDGSLFLTTNSNNRSFRNIESRPVASLMIDTRKPGFEYGLTAAGTASPIRGAEAQELSSQIHERYLTEKALSDPKISGFFTPMTTLSSVCRRSHGHRGIWDNLMCNSLAGY